MAIDRLPGSGYRFRLKNDPPVVANKATVVARPLANPVLSRFDTQPLVNLTTGLSPATIAPATFAAPLASPPSNGALPPIPPELLQWLGGAGGTQEILRTLLSNPQELAMQLRDMDLSSVESVHLKVEVPLQATTVVLPSPAGDAPGAQPVAFTIPEGSTAILDLQFGPGPDGQPIITEARLDFGNTLPMNDPDVQLPWPVSEFSAAQDLAEDVEALQLSQAQLERMPFIENPVSGLSPTNQSKTWQQDIGLIPDFIDKTVTLGGITLSINGQGVSATVNNDQVMDTMGDVRIASVVGHPEENIEVLGVVHRVPQLGWAHDPVASGLDWVREHVPFIGQAVPSLQNTSVTDELAAQGREDALGTFPVVRLSDVVLAGAAAGGGAAAIAVTPGAADTAQENQSVQQVLQIFDQVMDPTRPASFAIEVVTKPLSPDASGNGVSVYATDPAEPVTVRLAGSVGQNELGMLEIDVPEGGGMVTSSVTDLDVSGSWTIPLEPGVGYPAGQLTFSGNVGPLAGELPLGGGTLPFALPDEQENSISGNIDYVVSGGQLHINDGQISLEANPIFPPGSLVTMDGSDPIRLTYDLGLGRVMEFDLGGLQPAASAALLQLQGARDASRPTLVSGPRNVTATLPPNASPLMQEIYAAVAANAGNGTVAPGLVATGGNSADVEALLGTKGLDDDIYQKTAEMILAAEHEVLVETFIWSPGEPGTQAVTDALRQLSEARAAQGATEPVQVHIVFNHVEATPIDYQALHAQLGGIDPRYVNVEFDAAPSAVTDVLHSKVVVVDGQSALLTSGNMNDDTWVDSGVTLEGPAALALRSEIGTTINGSRRVVVPTTSSPSGALLANMPRATALSWTEGWLEEPLDDVNATGGVPMLIVTRPPDVVDTDAATRPQNVALLTAIESAQTSIRVVSPNLNDREIVLALEEAVRRGVRVELLLSKNFNDGNEMMSGELMRDSVFLSNGHPAATNDLVLAQMHEDLGGSPLFQAYWFTDPQGDIIPGNLPGASHMKYLSVDGQVAFVGSTNMDVQSTMGSQEVLAVVDSRAAVAAWDQAFFEQHVARGGPSSMYTP